MTPDELRKRRKILGMSQAKLAAALGVDENTIGSWESGRNTIPPYLHLALDELYARRHRKGHFTEADIAAIRSQSATRSYISLATEYGVTRETIRNIVHGQTWSHLPPAPPDAREAALRRKQHGHAHLTEAQAQEILDARGQRSAPDLAREFGISAQSIYKIWWRSTWVNLQPKPEETPDA